MESVMLTIMDDTTGHGRAGDEDVTEHREVRVATNDGLQVFVRAYGTPTARTTLACLPGLTRNSRDFAALAASLGVDRLVLCPDFRGRGFSDYDATGSTYRPDVYAADVVAVLDTFGVERAVLLGTSLGGSVAMHTGATYPDRVAGLVLNDVGPQLDPTGFARIQAYVGKLPPAASWDEAVAQLRAMAEVAAPGLSDEDWARRTREQYREFEPGSIRPDHDPAIVRGMEAVDPTAIPDSWPVFDRLASIPMLVLRGALSDLLSAATVERMAREHPGLQAVTVPQRGHTPLLEEPACRDALDAFLPG